MVIIGCDYHPSMQQIAWCDNRSGAQGERRLEHASGEAEKFYRELKQRGVEVRVGLEASGHTRWFERLLAELEMELWIGHPAKIAAQQMRTRVKNQLQSIAMNEGVRRQSRLWSKPGRAQLESFALPPWSARRRHDLLQLLDQLNPQIAELSRAIEQEAERRPEVLRLMTHPGVGPITALAFVLVLGTPQRFPCGKQVGTYLGLIPS